MSKPLENITVLDLSRVLAGPFTTMMLGDMGAQVIKIEEPAAGDDTRRWGPPFVEGESAYYLSINRNKKSLAVNLKRQEGVAVVRRLAATADVLVENFRPGVLARLGLGYEDVRKVNPRLVYCSVSGFGQYGPESHRPGYDLVIQGEGGVMSLTGMPDGPPTKVGISFADLVAGLYAVQGILLALRVAEQTGIGQHVDVSLLDCQIALLTFQAQSYFLTGINPTRMGNDHPMITPYETFPTADGFLNIAVGNESQWQRFCVVIGRNDLANDQRFSSVPLRVQNRWQLKPLLTTTMRQRSTREWLDRLAKAEIVCGPVKTVEEVLSGAQVAAREMVAQFDHPKLGPTKVCGIPIKLSRTPGEVRSAPPLLGQHSEEVLIERLGMDREEISRLRQCGAI
jgi:crotonobetainyl-CoA:carnitine CoA-transferase CaiB-like acyl-CoA transferase